MAWCPQKLPNTSNTFCFVQLISSGCWIARRWRSWIKLLSFSSSSPRSAMPCLAKNVIFLAIATRHCRLIFFSSAWALESISPMSFVVSGIVTRTATAVLCVLVCSWRAKATVASFQLQNPPQTKGESIMLPEAPDIDSFDTCSKTRGLESYHSVTSASWKTT